MCSTDRPANGFALRAGRWETGKHLISPHFITFAFFLPPAPPEDSTLVITRTCSGSSSIVLNIVLNIILSTSLPLRLANNCFLAVVIFGGPPLFSSLLLHRHCNDQQPTSILSYPIRSEFRFLSPTTSESCEMATYPMHNNYYRPSTLTVDTRAQNYFEEDEGSILDENILDHSALDSGLEMSPPMNGSRRDSFAVSSALFSPKVEEWQHVDMHSMPSNNPFVEQNNNPFMRVDSQSSSYGHQGHGWAMSNGSGMSTPMQGHDGLPSDFDGGAPIFQRPIQTQTPFSSSGNQPSLFSSTSTSNGSIPPSPQKEWSVADAMDHRAMPKRMRPHSPALRSHLDMSRRGDGIRKKNARFDIPAERNLTNIDQLIAQSTDEQEIKELKQQKRLLRNRQAAYGPPFFGVSSLLVSPAH